MDHFPGSLHLGIKDEAEGKELVIYEEAQDYSYDDVEKGMRGL